MGIKTYRPTTSSLRHRTGLTYEELTTDKPVEGRQYTTQQHTESYAILDSSLGLIK